MNKKGKGTIVVTLEVKVRWDNDKAKTKVMKDLAATFNGKYNQMACISTAGYSWDLANKNARVEEKPTKPKYVKL